MFRTKTTISWPTSRIIRQCGLLCGSLAMGVSMLRGQPSLTRLTTDVSRDTYPLWRPDGSKILFSSNRNNVFRANDVWEMNPDGSGQRELIHVSISTPAAFGDPGLGSLKFLIQPSGDLLVYEAQSLHELMRVALSAATSYPIVRTVQNGGDSFFSDVLQVPGGQNIGYFTLSNDSRMVAWSAFVGGGAYQVRSALLSSLVGQGSNIAGSLVFQNSTGGAEGLSFSPDGTRLVAATCFATCTGKDLYVLNVSTGTVLRRLTSNAGASISNREPKWSPDGQWIAFTSNSAGNDDIWLIHPDGSGLTQVTTDPSANYGADWSPDGRALAFTTLDSTTGNYDVWLAGNLTPSSGQLSVTPPVLTFTYPQGFIGPLLPQQLTVNSAGTPLTVSASATGGNWLSVSPSSGVTPLQLGVTANLGLPVGTYTGQIVVASGSATNSPQVIPATLTVPGIIITSTPPGAGFQVNGPGLFYYIGMTPAVLPSAPIGDYTVTWNILGGYSRPTQQSFTLLANRALAISATYLPILTRTAPFDFFVGCNASIEVASFGSNAAAIVDSDPLKGVLNLSIQALGLVANVQGQSGIGIRYVPPFTGNALVRVTILIRPPSFDLVYVTGIPKVGNAGIAGLQSYLFISASPPVDDMGTLLFRNAYQSPAPGGTLSTIHQYNPAEQYTFSRVISVTKDQQRNICVGLQSKGTVTGFPGTTTMAKGLYSSALVTQIEVIPQ